MVPLVGENRLLAIYGLHVLRQTKRPGLRKLLENSKTTLSTLSEDDVAFSIAPRVNAASRMDHPVHAFNMFSLDVKLGTDSAHHLESLNTTRKESVAAIMKKVYKTLDEKFMIAEIPNIIVAGDSDWAPGILGIIASNIMEKYGRSVFVFGKGEKENSYKGSCRSIGDVHVVELMSLTSNLYTHFGGHESAGGFSLLFKNLHKLDAELNKNYQKAVKKDLQQIEHERREARTVDSVHNTSLAIDLEDVTSEFITGLSLIGPFGVGNPKPTFTIRNIQSFEVKRFGKKSEHLKITLQSRTTTREAIQFFVDKEKEKELAQHVRELHFTLEPGWQGGAPRLKII
jgi:single-stranded-DNA-specific exonuclease